MNANTHLTKNRRLVWEQTRIIWAIASKDIWEALKNKNTLAVLLTALPMIFIYYYLPILGSRGEAPLLRVHDAGDSVLVARLENSERVDLRTYPSEAEMKRAMTRADVPELGLVIPAGLDQVLEAGGEARVQGHVLSWVDPAAADELLRMVESEIALQLGQPVTVDMQAPVYLEPDSTGIGASAAIASVFVITMIGLTLIPHLILEEKSTRTMDALLISPAGGGDLVTGKALAGLFYCLLGAGVALAFYHWLVIHWWLAVLATILGALFTISLGLTLGSIIESRAQLTMWAWVFILPLFLPVFLSLMGGLVPDPVIRVLRLIPTVVVLDLLRTSYAAAIPVGGTLLRLGWLAAWAGAWLLLVAWLVRRQDRQPAKSPAVDRFAERSITPIWDGVRSRLSALFSGRARPLVQTRTGQEAAPETVTGPTATGPVGLERGGDGLRIVWAIASKDIGATLKNKLAISIIIGTALVLATSAVVPFLTRLRDRPVMVVYDQGRSTILRALAASDDLRLGIVDSMKEMEETVGGSPELVLGLVLPEDFDRRAGSGDVIALDAYVVHWADPEKVGQRVAFFQEQLSASTWGEVQINVAGQRLYPPAELQGQTFMFALTFTIVLLSIGMALVPLLLVEERQAHTFEVLMISPAGISEVVGGKALAGAFYCLLAALVVFLFNGYLIIHWGVALLSIILGAAFAVGVGLLVGILFDSPASIGLWGGLTLAGLIGLAIINLFPDLGLPPVVRTLLDLMPTSALTGLLGYSLAGEIPLAQVGVNAAALLTAGLIVFGLLAWRLRVADR